MASDEDTSSPVDEGPTIPRVRVDSFESSDGDYLFTTSMDLDSSDHGGREDGVGSSPSSDNEVADAEEFAYYQDVYSFVGGLKREVERRSAEVSEKLQRRKESMKVELERKKERVKEAVMEQKEVYISDMCFYLFFLLSVCHRFYFIIGFFSYCYSSLLTWSN